MDRLHDVVRECLDLAIRLRCADPAALPQAEHLKARFSGFVDEMLRKAADAGFSDQDAQDLAFPVVALLDEVALGKGEAIRQHWQQSPLQMEFFNEGAAGERFFDRLADLRGEPERLEILRVYYLCLALGFEGKYRVRGGELELMTLTDALAKEVARHRKHEPSTLSTTGKWASDSLVSGRSARAVLWVSMAAFSLALVIYVGLWVSLKISVGESTDEISAVGIQVEVAEMGN